jgi:hypothetical protein
MINKAYINNELVELTDEELAAAIYQPPATENEVRQERDQLIAKTDTWA